MTTTEILSATITLLSDPVRWCQGAYGIGKSGKKVKDIKRAVRFDIIGALAHVSGHRPVDVEKGKNGANEALRMVSRFTPGVHQPVFVWSRVTYANDQLKHGEVLDLLRAALQHAQELVPREP